MSDCCKDNTCTPGTISAPSDCFDDCRLSLSQDDFKKIDTNNSGALTASELQAAKQFSGISEDKMGHLNCIAQTVANSEVDVNINGSKVKLGATLPSWHTTDFAKQQLSNDDFKIIDSNGDNMLDSKELKTAAGKDSKLSNMDKHAASILGAHLDASLGDPLLDLNGGVKNWREHSILKKADDAAATLGDKAARVPGADLGVEREVSVSEVDAQGRPTVLESAGAVHRLKYDESGRVSQLETDYGTDDIHGGVTKFSYDDAARTQTIQTEGLGENGTKTVNHLDKDGKIVREEHTYPDGETTATTFDGQGRISSQTQKPGAGGRAESKVQYDENGERISSSTARYDASGKKTQDSIYNYGDKSSMIINYGKKGDMQRVTSVANENNRTVTLQTDYTSAGKPIQTHEVRTRENSRLVEAILERDAENRVVAEAKALWKPGTMHSPRQLLEGVEVKYFNGETKTLNSSSTGADAVQFKALQNEILRRSNSPTESYRVPEESPGSWHAKVFNAAPC